MMIPNGTSRAFLMMQKEKKELEHIRCNKLYRSHNFLPFLCTVCLDIEGSICQISTRIYIPCIVTDFFRGACDITRFVFLYASRPQNCHRVMAITDT